MAKTEYDLEKIFEEVDNGKYFFRLRPLCAGMAKTILKYKSMILKNLTLTWQKCAVSGELNILYL